MLYLKVIQMCISLFCPVTWKKVSLSYFPVYSDTIDITDCSPRISILVSLPWSAIVSLCGLYFLL